MMRRLLALLLVGSLGSLAQAGPNKPSKPDQPTILSVNGRVVRASVPAGVSGVAVEVRPRDGGGSWKRKLSVRLDGRGGVVKFVLKNRVAARNVRVVPAHVAAGPHRFLRVGGSGNSAAPGAPFTIASLATDSSGRSSVVPLTVQESDIWQIRGNTLYFFNQYRGLQIIDLTNPDAPVLIGQLPLPAAGEQMYLVGDHDVALLTQSWNLWSSDDSQSAVVLVDVADVKNPKIVAQKTVRGSLSESRLIGNEIYLASQYYDYAGAANDPDWWSAYGTEVTAFDLTDPANPVAGQTLDVPGYGSVVAANDQNLFISTMAGGDWDTSLVQVIDISSADGTLKSGAQITPAGYVPDKFKFDQRGAVLTIISETSGVVNVDGDDEWQTSSHLENFQLSGTTAPKVGTLELGSGDQLFGTRFDGDRAYVVTYFQEDPLWIVDLTDSANPVVSGHVSAPGFSNYLDPMGDRLVTMGQVDGNAAVSLFDVSDATHPQLLSQVKLGGDWSWSEAQSDEKAFTVLPDDGLILVPFNGFTDSGEASGVQLIDLNRDSLVVRGAIQQTFPLRRATVIEDRVVAISGTALLTADATDQDHPVVKGDLTLAWPADRIFAVGDYLVELGGGDGWSADTAILTVASKSDPNSAVGSLALSNVPIVGATVRDGVLYVAQSNSRSSFFYANDSGDGTTTPTPEFTVSAVDVSKLPAVTLLGAQTTVLDVGSATSFEALWPSAGTLVWFGREVGFWFYNDIRTLTPATTTAEARTIAPTAANSTAFVPATGAGHSSSSLVRIWPGFGGNSSAHLVAFSVANPAAPAFLSHVQLGNASANDGSDTDTTDTWRNFSDAFLAGSSILVSHDRDCPLGEEDPVVNSDGEIVVREDDGTDRNRTYASSFLDAVDYTDATTPAVHEPLEIPGLLEGLSSDGTRLFTSGDFDGSAVPTNTDSAHQYLQASAYDGTAATLLDVLDLGENSGVITSAGDFVYVSSYTADDSGAGILDAFGLDPNAKWQKLAEQPLADASSQLATFGQLLASEDWSGDVALFDITGGGLQPLGQFPASNVSGGNLQQAAGSLGQGLWLPLGLYGVQPDLLGP